MRLVVQSAAMSGTADAIGRWPRVPVGLGFEQWRTSRFERTVLVVARTLTSTVWGLDFLGEVLADPRIQTVFTVEDESPSVFWQGAHDLLDLVEAPVVPWAQAVSTRFDLAVCSSLRGSLDRLMSPLLVGMHGAGIGKSTALLPGRRVPRPSAAGRREGVAATTVAVAHPEQSRFFADTDPDMDLVVVGDPCLDRLAASELQRGRYRNMLGLLPNQRFVLLSSTWGAGSLLDASPDIATRLAARLPNDGYRIALVLHPNIWIGHGGWQVRSWLGRARDAGVLVVAPWHNSWRSCLVASDVVVHDHGSLGLYAAALQRPTVTAGFASEQAMPGSAIAQLGELSPRLDLNRPLRHQIDDAVANYEPHRYLDAARRVSAAPGDSMRLHRDLIYRLMGLDPPDTDPRVLAVDAPAEPLPAVHSHRVATVVRASRTVTLDRFPASTPPPPAIQPSRAPGISCATPRSPTPPCHAARPSSSTRPGPRVPRNSWPVTPDACMWLCGPPKRPRCCGTAKARATSCSLTSRPSAIRP